MFKDIRKLSVGADFPNNSIYYKVGGIAVKSNRTEYRIHSIIESIEFNVIKYDIYISNNKHKLLWKTIFNTMPITIEYNIDFD